MIRLEIFLDEKTYGMLVQTATMAGFSPEDLAFGMLAASLNAAAALAPQQMRELVSQLYIGVPDLNVLVEAAMQRVVSELEEREV